MSFVIDLFAELTKLHKNNNEREDGWEHLTCDFYLDICFQVSLTKTKATPARKLL